MRIPMRKTTNSPSSEAATLPWSCFTSVLAIQADGRGCRRRRHGGTELDANRDRIGAEEPSREEFQLLGTVPLLGDPRCPVEWVVVVDHGGGSVEPVASALDAHTRVGEEVADVPGAVTMFGDDPQVVVDHAVHHWCASPLAAVAAGGLEEDERQGEPEQQCCSGRGIGDVLLGAANKMPLALEVTVGEPAAGNEPSEHDERRRQDPAPGGCGVTGDHHD